MGCIRTRRVFVGSVSWARLVDYWLLAAPKSNSLASVVRMPQVNNYRDAATIHTRLTIYCTIPTACNTHTKHIQTSHQSRLDRLPTAAHHGATTTPQRRVRPSSSANNLHTSPLTIAYHRTSPGPDSRPSRAAPRSSLPRRPRQDSASLFVRELRRLLPNPSSKTTQGAARCVDADRREDRDQG